MQFDICGSWKPQRYRSKTKCIFFTEVGLIAGANKLGTRSHPPFSKTESEMVHLLYHPGKLTDLGAITLHQLTEAIQNGICERNVCENFKSEFIIS